MGGFFAGTEFEARKVKFDNTRKPLIIIARVIGGVAVFLIFNTLLKLPFSSEFLDSGTFLAGIVRFMRYLIVAFLMIGIYPMIFKVEKTLPSSAL